ncbi:DUF1622 domain-containing protein [Pannus brasiliensis CCIBt3594]|uniref:DUF1622 domain-containing protein n=1 Tax=Pannus brasiliensis CCIBt3594 TaxID=1427578 RepID=A0AAW9QQ32_9CHRO
MEWFEPLEISLTHLVAIVKFCLETISVVCVMIGLVQTIKLALTLNPRRNRDRVFSFNPIRIRFGSWLALALEFQLGADIVATTVSPTLEELAQLAIIAAIRTFLNYFLAKELETEQKLVEKREKEGDLSPEIPL